MGERNARGATVDGYHGKESLVLEPIRERVSRERRHPSLECCPHYTTAVDRALISMVILQYAPFLLAERFFLTAKFGWVLLLLGQRMVQALVGAEATKPPPRG